MELVIASNNRHKAEEIKTILGGAFDRTSTLREKNVDVDPEENGATFLENAAIKARAVAELLPRCAVIADDSGLCVDALAGAPGTLSARFAGEPCNDDANNEKLLSMMREEKNRGAQFVSVVFLLLPDGSEFYGEGSIKGEILTAPRGEGGFGYDPLFYIPESGKTFAQMDAAEKNRISHRKRALQDLLARYNAR